MSEVPLQVSRRESRAVSRSNGEGFAEGDSPSAEGCYQYRCNQLAADNLPIIPTSYHPPADNTTLVKRGGSSTVFGSDVEGFPEGEDPGCVNL